MLTASYLKQMEREITTWLNNLIAVEMHYDGCVIEMTRKVEETCSKSIEGVRHRSMLIRVRQEAIDTRGLVRRVIRDTVAEQLQRLQRFFSNWKVV